MTFRWQKRVLMAVWLAMPMCNSFAQTSAVGTPPQASYHTIPVQSYAAIDISGTTATTNVWGVALNDSNNAAFAYTFPNASGTCNTYTWQNGTLSSTPVSSLQLLECTGTGSPFEGDGLVYQISYFWSQFVPMRVFPDGTLAGGIADYEEDLLATDPPPSSPPEDSEGYIQGYAGWTHNPFLKSYTEIGAPSPFIPSEWPGPYPQYHTTDGAQALCFSSNGTCGAYSGGYTAILTSTGAYQIPYPGPYLVDFTSSGAGLFAPGVTLPPNTVNPSNIFNENFGVGIINDNGAAVGSSGTNAVFWSGTGSILTPLAPMGSASAMNNQNQVVGTTGTNAYLWSSGSGSQLISQLIPTSYQPEISDISPIDISGSNSTDGSVRILFNATYATDSNQDTATGTFLLTLTSGTSATTSSTATSILQQVSLPPNVPFSFNNSMINASGVIAGLSTGPVTTGTITTSGTAALLLLPVQLKQTNYPTNCLADDTDPGLTGTQTISSGTSGVPSTAYITGSAAMPTLQVSIANGSLSGMQVQWWMTSTTDRPAARGTQDNVTVPNPQIGYRTLPINQPWEIDNDYGGQFFGGVCTINYIIQDSNGNALTPTQQFQFLIRGRNPMDANAKTYIQNNEGNYYYAWAIAQHESRTPSNKIYNQFATANGSSWGDLGQPFYSPLEGNGWGMFQRDPTGGGIAVTTAQVYSWQTNTQVAITELQSKQAAQQRFFNAVANAYPNDPEAQNPPSSYPAYPGSSTNMSALDMGTITLYNSAAGGTHELGFTNPWYFNENGSSGHKWSYTPNVNNYLYHVIHDEYEGHLQTSE